MRLFRLTALVCCVLATVSWCQVSWAEAAAEENAPAKEAPAKEAEEQQPAEEESEALKTPSYLKNKRLYGLPELKPKKIRKVAPLVLYDEKAQAQAKKKSEPAAKKAPVRRKPSAPFWVPRQRSLTPAASFQLQSMSQRNVQLSPAMQWHMNQAYLGAVSAPPGGTQQAEAAPSTTPVRFYPGISRLPPQKPFADREPEPSGFERYWPLLLEGRQDPNTGLIIWRLP